MSVSFTELQIGSDYTRPQLAKLWGYEGYQAISRGIVTPSGTPYIILFITEEKQAGLTQYHDILEDDILHIEGEIGHTTDQRIVQAKENGDEIHLFHRKRHHSPFIYYGRVCLTDYVLNSEKPSKLRFKMKRFRMKG